MMNKHWEEKWMTKPTKAELTYSRIVKGLCKTRIKIRNEIRKELNHEKG